MRECGDVFVVVLVVAVTVLAAGGAALAQDAAERVLAVTVHEQQGLPRRGELVCVEVGEAEGPQVRNDRGEPVPSQLVELGGKRTLWFAADVDAGRSRTYSVVDGEPAAPADPLRVEGQPAQEEVWITSAFWRIRLMPNSANLDRFVLPGEPERVIFNKVGPVHWNPDVWSPNLNRPWRHTLAWKPAPGLRESRGPLLYVLERKGPLPEYDELDVEVRYRFSATEPCVWMESTTSILKDITVRALRNGESVFAPELFSHAACRDREGVMHSWKLEPHEEGAPPPPARPDDLWLAFYNPDNGLGIATIRLLVENTGPGGGEPTLVGYDHMMIGVYDTYDYWSRALVFPAGKVEDVQNVVPVPAGNVYREKEAWLVFRAEGGEPFAEVDAAAQRLLHPLKVHVQR